MTILFLPKEKIIFFFKKSNEIITIIYNYLKLSSVCSFQNKAFLGVLGVVCEKGQEEGKGRNDSNSTALVCF